MNQKKKWQKHYSQEKLSGLLHRNVPNESLDFPILGDYTNYIVENIKGNFSSLLLA